MSTVKGFFYDPKMPDYKGRFELESDQEIGFFNWKPPIGWSGYVNGIEVSFLQLKHNSDWEGDYDFTNFPESLNYTKHFIVKAIDDAMWVVA